MYCIVHHKNKSIVLHQTEKINNWVLALPLEQSCLVATLLHVLIKLPSSLQATIKLHLLPIFL